MQLRHGSRQLGHGSHFTCHRKLGLAAHALHPGSGFLRSSPCASASLTLDQCDPDIKAMHMIPHPQFGPWLPCETASVGLHSRVEWSTLLVLS